MLNADSIFGRIVPGLITNRAGSPNTIVPYALIDSVLAFAWLDIKNAAGMLVSSVLYGFFSGAMVSLPPPIIGWT